MEWFKQDNNQFKIKWTRERAVKRIEELEEIIDVLMDRNEELEDKLEDFDCLEDNEHWVEVYFHFYHKALKEIKELGGDSGKIAKTALLQVEILKDERHLRSIVNNAIEGE